MNTLKERFETLVQQFGDVDLETASNGLRIFFRQELRALAEEVEEYPTAQNAAYFIRSKADELITN